MDIAQVLLKAREQLGWTKAEAARRLKVSRQTIKDWESGRSAPTRKRAPVVAEIYQIPVASISSDPLHGNVAFLAKTDLNHRRVPVLDWVDAGRGAELAVAYPIDGPYETIDTTEVVSTSSFALRVRGNSMEPDFRHGDVIIIDPLVPPYPECLVVAELQAKGESPGPGDVTFKQFRPRGPSAGGPSFDLLPYNPDYETITVNKNKPGRILGVVVEHRRNLRR